MYLETGSLCKEHVSIASTSNLVISILKFNLNIVIFGWKSRLVITFS